MPQVPYNPVPQGPEFRPSGPLAPQVSPQAFGANVGQAIEGFGGKLEKSADELWNRAMWIQEIHNDNEARQALSGYMGQQGDMHEQFGAKQGAGAGPDALRDYTQKSRELLNTTADGLSNPMARKKFLDQATFYLGRNINAAAGHSAKQTQNYTDSTINSTIQARFDASNLHPTDQALYQQTVDELRGTPDKPGLFDTKQGIYGWSDQTKNEELAKTISGLTASRIDGLSKTDPPGARRMMEDSIKDGTLRQEDINKTYDQVKKQIFSATTRHVINETMNTDGRDISYGSKVVPNSLASKAISGVEGNYDSVVDTGTKQGNALGKYQVTEANLPAFLRFAGLSQMTPQEFIRNHDAQEKVFAANFGALQQKYGNFNDAAREWFAGPDWKRKSEAGITDKFQTTVEGYVRKANSKLAGAAPNEALISKAQDRAEELSGDDPFMSDFPQAVVDGMAHELGRRQYQQRLDNWDRVDKVNDYLLNLLNPGQPVPTLNDIKTRPEWEDMTRGMNSTQVVALETKVDSFLKSRFKETEDVEKGRLINLADKDPEVYLDEDIAANPKLSPADKKTFIAMRRAIRNNQEADPQVGRAMNIFSRTGLLEDLALDKKDDETRYNQFTALLFDALTDQRIENKGQQPTAQQIEEIGKRLKSGYASGFFSAKPAFFERHMTLSAQEVEKRRDDFAAQNPDEPMLTDAEIARNWIREEYEKQYKIKKKAAKAGGSPEVPM